MECYQVNIMAYSTCVTARGSGHLIVNNVMSTCYVIQSSTCVIAIAPYKVYRAKYLHFAELWTRTCTTCACVAAHHRLTNAALWRQLRWLLAVMHVLTRHHGKSASYTESWWRVVTPWKKTLHSNGEESMRGLNRHLLSPHPGVSPRYILRMAMFVYHSTAGVTPTS